MNNKNKPSSFVNRTQELALLERLYKEAEKEGQFLVLYGKRRVGKTELIKHFFQNKPHFYYLASRIAAKDQLKTLSEVLADYLEEPLLKNSPFTSWRDLFDFLGKKMQQNKTPQILVFDEFPYLVEGESGMSSFFQYGWDECLKQTKTLLILSGSSIGMMYKHALAYSAPLYGRRTSQWFLESFTFHEAKKYFSTIDFEKAFAFYAITGGIPGYLKQFDPQRTLWENIQEKILPKGTLMNSDPELIVSEELNEPQQYLTILKAIGSGRTKFSEIISVSNLAPNIVTKYIGVLMQLRWVKREVPVTEDSDNSKKGSYVLADPYLRFYYSFIFPNQSALESMRPDIFLKKIKEGFPYFISKIYEDTTKEFIQTAMQENKLSTFYELGRWWDKNTEIDLVGLNKDENAILFVETKWNTKLLRTDVLENLKQKAQHVTWGKPGRKEQYALVAKGGFTPELRAQAKTENVLLIQEDKIIQ
jgi:AAA+ ATPase superfamily predicted ATPase